jgi:L-threonylcarbamoyladenylate synthase
VRDEFGTAIDYVLDGGPCDVGLESTIVDVSGIHAGRGPRLLRPGAITAAMLAGVLGRPLKDHNQTAPRVPGRLPSHYAPRARVVLAADRAAATIEIERHLRQGHVVGVLAVEPMPALPQAVAALPLPPDLDAQARLLYTRLREADRLGLDILIAIPPPPGAGLADAIRDRLARAAGPRQSQ